MKKFMSIVFAIIALQMSITAQVDEKTLFQKKIKTYTRMHNTGIMLTVGGGFVGGIGFAILLNAPSSQAQIGPTEEDVIYAIVAASGIIVLGCGVTFWTVGGVNKAKYTKKLNALSLNLNPSLKQKVSLVYRF